MLFLIETKHLHLLTEMAEELAVDRAIIKESVERLKAKGFVYQIRRFVPLSGRPQSMIKSTRFAPPEAGSLVSNGKVSIWNEAAWEN